MTIADIGEFALIARVTARLGAGRLGAGRLGAGRVGAGRVGAARVGAGQLGAGQLGAGQLGAGQLGAGHASASTTAAGADAASPYVRLGPGDDAAVVAAPDGRVVVTTDLLVDGHHFRRDWSSAYDVGRKAAAQNLADVMAMGARPTALVVGLAAPGALPVTWAEELADGLADEAALTGAAVVGGDMTASETLVLAVTAFGDLEGRAPLTRTGARPGDVVAVAGRLGWAAAGLRLLHAGEVDGPLVAAHRRPAPPYDAGPLAAATGATAAIDVSDGLAADLGHVAAGSGVRIDLSLTALRRLGGPGITDEELITGGEDHALAMTLPPRVDPPAGAVVVGAVASGEGVYVDGARCTGTTGHAHWSR